MMEKSAMNRDEYSDAIDRKPGEYILFALAFVGFVIAVVGITVTSPHIALFGTLALILAVLGFQRKP